MKLFPIAAAALVLMCASCKGSSETTDAAGTDSVATNTEQAAPAPAELPDTVIVATDDALLRPGQAGDVLTVLDFNAVWCGPCKRLNEPMERAANKYAGNVVFYSVDFEKLPETGAAYEITNVPVVVFQKPDGTTVRIDGIGDFITPDEQKNLSKEDAADKIFENLCRIIDNNLN